MRNGQPELLELKTVPSTKARALGDSPDCSGWVSGRRKTVVNRCGTGTYHALRISAGKGNLPGLAGIELSQ
jgi:hypothetical protein